MYKAYYGSNTKITKHLTIITKHRLLSIRNAKVHKRRKFELSKHISDTSKHKPKSKHFSGIFHCYSKTSQTEILYAILFQCLVIGRTLNSEFNNDINVIILNTIITV